MIHGTKTPRMIHNFTAQRSMPGDGPDGSKIFDKTRNNIRSMPGDGPDGSKIFDEARNKIPSSITMLSSSKRHEMARNDTKRVVFMNFHEQELRARLRKSSNLFLIPGSVSAFSPMLSGERNKTNNILASQTNNIN
jgi:hypothetical protein